MVKTTLNIFAVKISTCTHSGVTIVTISLSLSLCMYVCVCVRDREKESVREIGVHVKR